MFLFQIGSFILDKKDLNNFESYPIWKIETNRMLQKFELFLDNGKIRHRALSTVSEYTVSLVISIKLQVSICFRMLAFSCWISYRQCLEIIIIVLLLWWTDLGQKGYRSCFWVSILISYYWFTVAILIGVALLFAVLQLAPIPAESVCTHSCGNGELVKRESSGGSDCRMPTKTYTRWQVSLM